MADEELNELEAETEDQEIEVATDEADGETGERDWEADARAMGWSPKAEFKGDKTHWIDAKSFVERGELTEADLDKALDLLSMTHPGVAK